MFNVVFMFPYRRFHLNEDVTGTGLQFVRVGHASTVCRIRLGMLTVPRMRRHWASSSFFFQSTYVRKLILLSIAYKFYKCYLKVLKI